MISELLLPEFDEEMKKTRTTLERVPEDKTDWKPHEKSAPFGKLAAHVAQLPRMASIALGTPELDFGTASMPRLVMESREQLLREFDKLVGDARAALAKASDQQWMQNWKMSFHGVKVFEGTRYQAFRGVFLDHLIHHRAQLGVYLRLNHLPVPATYGPSADDTMGF